MKKRIAAGLMVVALAAAPVASFAHGDEADVTLPIHDADPTQGNLYVDVETTGLWQESNGDAGLQTAAHTHGEGDEAITIPADTRIAP